MNRLMRLVSAGLVLAGFSLATAATAAAGPSATLQANGTAKLQPDGSALVTLNYSCLPGTGNATGEIIGNLQQPNAFGFTGATVTCDDANHTISLDFAPGRFTDGDAALSVDLNAPNAFVETNVEVNIE